MPLKRRTARDNKYDDPGKEQAKYICGFVTTGPGSRRYVATYHHHEKIVFDNVLILIV